MARKAQTAQAESHVVTKEQTPAIEAAAEAANQMAVIQHQYGEDRDLANQMLGQIQMSISISKFTTVVGLSKLREIKESKLYKALAGKTIVLANGENTRLVGTWAEYCELLGTSANKIDEDLQNLRVFGEDAMESLTRIGAGYRELRQLRKLPDSEQQELIEVAKLGDKESFVELAEEIISKHAKEKEELTKANAELKADYEAQGTIIKKKDEKLNGVERQLHKLQNRAGDWHPRATEIAIETTRHAAAVLENLDYLDDMRNAILTEDFGDKDREAAIEAMAVVYYDGVAQVARRLDEVMAACEEVFMGYKSKARPLIEVDEFLKGVPGLSPAKAGK